MQADMKNRDFRPMFRFISEMMQVRAIVTIEGEYENVAYTTYRMVPFSMTLVTLNPNFKFMMLFNIK